MHLFIPPNYTGRAQISKCYTFVYIVKGASTSSNIASNIAGHYVAHPSTLSKFPAKQQNVKNCGKYRHPHLAILQAIVPEILWTMLHMFNFPAILLAI